MSREQPPSLSVLVPMYNEEPALDRFFPTVQAVLEEAVEDYEIVCVDDGSSDGTREVLREWHRRDPRIVVVALTRNFGKERALTAGLAHCSKRTVLPMDADLQDPPDVIPEMIERWQAGYDVVYGTRLDRSRDHPLKRWTADWFYRVYNAVAEVPIPPNTGDFRLMDRRVVEAVLALPERNRFMKGLFHWVGYRSTSVGYVREPRVAGETKFNYWRLWNFALDGITASTTLPLRMTSYLGVLVSLGAIAYAIKVIVKTLWFGVDVPGYASIMVCILMLSGVQLISLGVIGEYLGRLYQESKRRPLYLVDEVLGGPGTPKSGSDT